MPGVMHIVNVIGVPVVLAVKGKSLPSTMYPSEAEVAELVTAIYPSVLQSKSNHQFIEKERKEEKDIRDARKSRSL